jgi:uncharacterized membrane protein
MPLIQLVVTLIIVGVLLWAMNTYIPMDPKIRQIINIVVVVAVVIWLLRGCSACLTTPGASASVPGRRGRSVMFVLSLGRALRLSSAVTQVPAR